MKQLATAATGCNSNLSDRYPSAPGFKVEGPSREAAEAIAPAAKNLRDRVLTLVQSLDPGDSLTADQIAIRLKRSPLSIRPRVSELAASGKLIRTRDRAKNASGMSATKWRAA
jgi:hypothetical protein